MTPSAQTAPVLTQNSPKTRDSRATGRWRRGLITTSFLAPALIVLGALVVYPIIYTLIRSFYSKSGSTFVGFDNYIAMFTNDTTYTAIRNNVMWVIIAPVVCTFLGSFSRYSWKSYAGRRPSGSSSSCPWLSPCWPLESSSAPCSKKIPTSA